MTKKRSAKRREKIGDDVLRVDDLTAAHLARVLKEVHKPLKIDDFLRVFSLPRRAKKTLEALLCDLMASGGVLKLSGGGYALASALKTTTGVLSMQRSGVGFVKSPSPMKGDVFISHNHLGSAWHGDTVEIVIFPDKGSGKRGKNRDGRIVNVLERAAKELVVRVVRNSKGGESLCEPTDARIPAMFLVDVSALDAPPSKHALLRARPGEQKGPDLWEATAFSLLGDEEDSAVQEELVKANHGIPRAFSPAALKEAAALPPVPDTHSLEGRRDLSALGFVTIDGATAKDFDDAVFVEKTAGGYALYVAVADAAHYVRPGSVMDADAFSRGNSYYFPRSVEPMLPEKLSTGLCSLNPGTPRLTMVVELHIADNGKIFDERFYSAIIISSARLTYDETRDALLNGDAAARERLAESLPMLENALALAHILAAARKDRGRLDFELPEPECLFDDKGELIAIAPRDNHFIHKLIEEFMVAANEAVARFLTDRELPVLYRAHPAPDPEKLRNLFHLLSLTGLMPQDMRPRRKDDAPPSPKQLQTLLDDVKGTPHEYLISRVALRSMMQAAYVQDLEGHFGLASECYCHFTSPIRRYADLVVHRSLKAALNAPDKSRLPGRKALQSVADHINAAERTAMEAEREIFRRMSVIFMRGRVGEEFDGIISGLSDFGIFVELDGVMVEGMVRLMDLNDDYYVYYAERQELRGERTGRAFRLGGRVRVKVSDVSVARLEITLEFVEAKRKKHAGNPKKFFPPKSGKSKRRG